MAQPGERTDLGDGVYVEYVSGTIVLENEGGIGGVVYLDQAAMTAFDRWRAKLDKDIALQARLNF